MAKKTVLIVARTKMYGAKVCVGALSDQGENLRLMNGNCESDIASRVPFRIGEWWEIDCDPCGARIPPHLEDVSVTNAAKVGEQANLSDYLLTVTNPWRGPIQMLFDGRDSVHQKRWRVHFVRERSRWCDRFLDSERPAAPRYGRARQAGLL